MIYVYTLDKIDIGSECIIKNINCESNIKRRLLDLGLIPGTIVKSLFISPLGDPTSYNVRGSVIAIRSEDARNIEVIYGED